MTRMITRLLPLLFLFSAVSVVAAPPVTGGAPISIRADRLQTDTQGRSALFSGHVVATQDDLTIYADTLTVIYAEQKKEVREVRAEGNVRIVQGERLGFAGRAVYDNQQGIIRLEDNPRVQQGDDTVTGGTILYSVAERKSTVESGGGRRVEAVINPSGAPIPGGKK